MRRAWAWPLAAGLVAACGRPEAPSPTAVTSPTITSAHGDVAVRTSLSDGGAMRFDAGAGQLDAGPVVIEAVIAFPGLPAVPASTRQLVRVVVANDQATAGHAEFFARDLDDEPWRLLRRWPVTVGHAGSAWGLGMHTSPPLGPHKREGDGKSPLGVFTISGAFGTGPAPSGTTLPYQVMTRDWRCIDDPASRLYGQVVDTRDLLTDWRSAEVMARPDGRYDLGLIIDHNPAHTPGAGSCIFAHLWTGRDDATIGCTAMAPADLRWLIATLRPNALWAGTGSWVITD